MITEFIINGFFAGLNALFSLMPDFILPEPSVGMLDLASYATILDDVFPISTLVNLAIAAMLVRTIIFGWDAIVFVYHQFWGGN